MCINAAAAAVSSGARVAALPVAESVYYSYELKTNSHFFQSDILIIRFGVERQGCFDRRGGKLVKSEHTGGGGAARRTLARTSVRLPQKKRLQFIDVSF